MTVSRQGKELESPPHQLSFRFARTKRERVKCTLGQLITRAEK